MFRSIRFKTWAHMMGIVATAIILMWLLGIVFLQNFYEYSKEIDIKKVQKEVCSILSQNEITEGYEKTVDISRDNDMFIEVYSNKGDIIITPFMYIQNSDNRISMPNMMTTIATSNIIKEMIAKKENNKIVKLQETNNKRYQAEVIILIDKISGRDGVYYIASRTSLMPVQATAEIVTKLFYILLFFVLIVSVILAITLSNNVTKPIRILSNGAQKVASGIYDVELPITNDDELGMLTRDFNEMTRELGKTDQIRKDLIANVSHELRTPLTMIRGYAETIMDLSGDIKEKREKQLSIIIDETDRLSALISSMLDLSQLQAEKVVFNYETINLSKMINKLVSRYEIFVEQGYKINTDISEDVIINGDYVRIEQVICNLLDNGINHSADVKIIDISLSKEGVFKVRNFGDIIEPENIKHIWERYYKIDKVGNRRVTGTGIGLSIVKEILVKHNIEFGVTSNEQNGTEFYINFKPLQ